MEEIRHFVKTTAEYFSKKAPREITFADADNFDFEIYQRCQEWNSLSPEKSFEEEFPEFAELWEELSTWNAQDDWDLAKCERIIAKAKIAANC